MIPRVGYVILCSFIFIEGYKLDAENFVKEADNYVTEVETDVFENSTSEKIRCLWFRGSCVKECPEWMVTVRSDCKTSSWPAQKTCDYPETKFVNAVCGLARCDCPEPSVFDTVSGFCYEVENCPKKHNVVPTDHSWM